MRDRLRRPILCQVVADLDSEKQRAAHAAAGLVDDGMRVGLGTGTTAAHFVAALAARHLDLRCVASSPRTERLAVELGLRVEPFTMARLDIAVDGADQVTPDGWLVKGGGAAHTREKLVAVTADFFVVIVDSSKVVARLRPPVPLELVAFGLESTLARLGSVRLRDVPRSPDGGVIADFTGDFEDPARLASWLDSTPGIVDHGLFPPDLVATVLIGRGDSVERRDLLHP